MFDWLKPKRKSRQNGPSPYQRSRSSEQSTTNHDSNSISIAIHRLIQSNETANYHQATYEQRKFHWDKWTAVGVWVYTFLTVITAGVSIWQINLAAKQIKLAELQLSSIKDQSGYMDKQTEILNRQTTITAQTQRAFVSINISRLVHGYDIEDRSKIGGAVFINLHNSGATATYHLRFAISCVATQNETTDPWTLLNVNEQNFEPEFIGSQQSIEANCGFLAEDISQIAARRKHGYIILSVRYFDRIDPTIPRQTQFVKEIVDGEFNPDTGGFARITTSSRGQHNCADEECPG